MTDMRAFDEYQKLALRTASAESLVDSGTMLNAAALGLNGEAGEIATCKTSMVHGHHSGRHPRQMQNRG